LLRRAGYRHAISGIVCGIYRQFRRFLERVPGDSHGTRVQAALRFVRSNPDISCAIIGLAAPAHPEEAPAGARMGALPGAAMERLDPLCFDNFGLRQRPGPLPAGREMAGLRAVSRACVVGLRYARQSVRPQDPQLETASAVNLQTRRLLALIDYAQETMRSRSRTVSDVAVHDAFLLYDHQVRDIEGVRLDPGAAEADDDVWLAMPHPPGPEMPPDPANPWLAPWLNIGTALQAAPGLAAEVEGVSLIAAGTHRDATQPAHGEALPAVDPKAAVRLSAYPQRAELERLCAHYVESEWQPWSEREQRRRRVSQLYVRLFTLQQQLSGALTEFQLELVWGMGLATRRQDGRVFSHPLVTRLVDIGFDAQTRAAEIRPRDLDPRLELDAFLAPDHPAAVEAEKAAAQFLAGAVTEVSPFDADSYRPLLDIARAAIAAAGGDAQAALEISDGWVLFARPRGTSLTVIDLERLRGALRELGDAAPLPPAVAALVTEPPPHNAPAALPVFRGLSAVYHENLASAQAPDLFFPKPFNDEQARICQLLEVSDGVAVQGPPGTGKTHTIANIICHWLANGRRVLVTSMRDPALSVLRDMLPADIRPLAIALLASEQEGLKQFEQSIEKIAFGVQSLDREALGNEIARLEEEIDALQNRLARIDIDIGRWARLNLSRIDLEGEGIDPQDAAAEVVEHAGQFDWLPDPLGVAPKYAPQFTEQDLARLREARARLGADVGYAAHRLPVPEGFPDPVRLAKAHEELQRYARLTEKAGSSDLPWPADAGADTVAAAHALAEDVQRIGTQWGHVLGARLPWSEDVVARIRRGEPAGPYEALDQLGAELDQVNAQRAAFLKRPVLVPERAADDPAFLQALDNLAQGRRAFGLVAFGKTDARQWVDAVRVGGSPPAGSGDWQHVVAYVSLQRKRRELTVRWNTLAAEVGLRTVLAADAKGRLSAEAQFAVYKALRELSAEQRRLAARAAQVFPGWTRAGALATDPKVIDELGHALDHHLTRHRLGEVSALVQALRAKLEGCSGRVVDDIRTYVSQRLGKARVDESGLLGGWSELMRELERLHALREPLETVRAVTAKIAESGAPKLAQQLLQPGSEALLPATFLRDWRLRRLATHVAAIDSQAEVKKLSAMRAGNEQDLARAYEGLVVRRTWYALAENVTPGVRAALQAYLNAIQRIGKGTGKRANRFRQDARYAAAEAHRAVPCWIMPHHRVSEALPAQLGCFDLVVIDEASQSDLSVLPVLLRAKKLLVVGDDRQVAPQAIGLEESRIKALMQRHLSEQVGLYRAQLSPDRSVYDLARVAFAGSGVMLREHFRCVAPIIEYAKREFYNHELRPLRLARGSERLDPPLLDVLVTNGRREGAINPQEIDFIVGDIRRIAEDPKLRSRSVGVVSLLGEEQALRIWERLLEELGPDLLRRHDVACGDARMFQGRERDIMFLTMVVAPNDVGAPLSRDTFAQRFNVASSRARDQMVLVRSVEPAQLAEGDRLRRGLIEHFAKPFGETPARTADPRELCESKLERELYDWLTAQGYRAMPQVRVGAYRIDLVVEGADDTRLAVECDGDKYQGPEQWVEDMRRQRALERTGWTFWRCFASSYIRRRDAVLEDLRQTLEAHRIQPTRSGNWARRRISETRKVQASGGELVA
jgi:very-short-patch-repair endonuclease